MKCGRKLIAIIFLSMATPLFYLFLITTGQISILFLALSGAFLLITFSVTVTVVVNILVWLSLVAGLYAFRLRNI
jgi:hypothetical protein